MNDRRWGFDGLDDGEYEEITRRRPARERRPAGEPVDAAATVSGQDADGVVTVHVTPDGEVVSVQVAADWKKSVDPRALGSSVLAAANNATLQALATQLDRAAQQPPAPQQAQPAPDGPPLSREDVDRLLDAVTADLERFLRQTSEITDYPVSAQSAGRHVSGTAHRGQVLQVSVDAGWAARSQASEIASELVDLLGQLRRKSTPGDLTAGPQSSAIAELTELTRDPATMLRRIGLIPGDNRQKGARDE